MGRNDFDIALIWYVAAINSPDISGKEETQCVHVQQR